MEYSLTAYFIKKQKIFQIFLFFQATPPLRESWKSLSDIENLALTIRSSREPGTGSEYVLRNTKD
jgi:hypothetical protein